MSLSFSFTSTPPHDFFLCLDIDSYFDFEHDPEHIAEEGFTRSIPLKDRDILATIFFNGDPDAPKFTVECTENLTDAETAEAEAIVRRIVGADLPLAALREQAAGDERLSPLLDQLYGFRRMAHANFFEEAVNRLIQVQISHKPTARKMVYGVRNAYAHRFETRNGTLAAWPRPFQLAGADPVAMKAYGLSERKGEYVVGLAHDILSGTFPYETIDALTSAEFLETLGKVRGIGPTTAQDLLLYRNRPDAIFPPKLEKGLETGFRKWICWAYGKDANEVGEKQFQELIFHWRGFEAMALEYFYADWMIREKRQKAEKKKKKV